MILLKKENQNSTVRAARQRGRWHFLASIAAARSFSKPKKKVTHLAIKIRALSTLAACGRTGLPEGGLMGCFQSDCIHSWVNRNHSSHWITVILPANQIQGIFGVGGASCAKLQRLCLYLVFILNCLNVLLAPFQMRSQAHRTTSLCFKSLGQVMLSRI